MTPTTTPDEETRRKPPPAGFKEELPERVIAASRRPDGSMRKEIRVRAGYVNQDEVRRYVVRGARGRGDAAGGGGGGGGGAGGVPGAFAEEAKSDAARKNARKKAAKKEKEKEKEKDARAKSGEGGDEEKKMKTTPPAAAAAAAPEDEDPARALSKRARAAKKKVRACEDLAARARDGADLDDDQRAKLEKMAAFAAEAEALERQLAALSTGGGGGRDATTGAGATLARP
jgi:partner of Y14 and mago protein